MRLGEMLGPGLAAALLLFVPAADPSFDGYQLPKELILIALAAWVVRPSGDRLSMVVWGFAVLSVVASLFASNLWLAARAAPLTIAAVALFEATRRLEPEGRDSVTRTLLVAVAALAGLAAIESQGLLPWLSREGRAPGATVGQRNAVAHVLVIAAPFVWARRGTRWLLLAGLLAAVVVLTRSRAAWLGGALALGVFLFTQRAGRGWIAVATVAGVALAGLLPTRLEWTSATPLEDTFFTLFDSGQGSGLARLIQWRASLGLVQAHPLLGVGPGNWMVAYPAVAPSLDPDLPFPTGRLLTNDWLAFAVERGAGSLLLVLAAAVLIARTSRSPAALAALAGLGTMMAFDSVLQLAAPVAAAAGLLGSVTPLTAPAPGARRELRWALIGLLGAAAINTALMLTAFIVRTREDADLAQLELAVRLHPGELRARWSLAEAHVAAGDCARAQPHLDALSQLLPNHPAVRAMRARCR